MSSGVLLKHGKRKADPSYFIESPAMSESSISKRALERRQKRERERAMKEKEARETEKGKKRNRQANASNKETETRE